MIREYGVSFQTAKSNFDEPVLTRRQDVSDGKGG